jgi:hypothetical protein
MILTPKELEYRNDIKAKRVERAEKKKRKNLADGDGEQQT